MNIKITIKLFKRFILKKPKLKMSINKKVTNPKVITSSNTFSQKKVGERVESQLGKRKYEDAFDVNNTDDARYDQHIGSDFFTIHVGHGVTNLQEATDNIITDFRKDLHSALPTMRRERDCESKYDVNEILAWCEYYLANKNVFNV
jgi:hypothetical protein